MLTMEPGSGGREGPAPYREGGSLPLHPAPCREGSLPGQNMSLLNLKFKRRKVDSRDSDGQSVGGG